MEAALVLTLVLYLMLMLAGQPEGGGTPRPGGRAKARFWNLVVGCQRRRPMLRWLRLHSGNRQQTGGRKAPPREPPTAAACQTANRTCTNDLLRDQHASSTVHTTPFVNPPPTTQRPCSPPPTCCSP